MACSKIDVERNNLVVAAIDFGTTYTGFAYSFKKNPKQILTSKWTGENVRTVTDKAPTCVLLSPDQKFIAFGFEAEEKYKDMLEENVERREEYFFFERFKMSLYQTKKLKLDTKLSDVHGKELAALQVFTAVINHIKEKFYEEMRNSRAGFDEDNDVQWVLTVPAIWSDSAKQFMRKAANEAGLNNVKLILEPEAASLYCYDENLCRIAKLDGSNDFDKFPEGMKYIVADLGGGTADLSVHEILSDRNLREIHRADGDALGGMMVDLEFFKFFEDIFGSNVIHLFSKRYQNRLMEIREVFETKKRTFKFKHSDVMKIKLPISELNEVIKETEGQNAETMIQKASKVDGFESLILKRDKLYFGKTIMEKCFSKAIEGIVQFINKMRENDELGEINHLLLVGGFSDSTYVQQIIRQKVPGVRVIIPLEPSLAVLKGAVIAGHNPKRITERIARYTYGFSLGRPFKQGEDPEELKFVENGMEYCSSVFDKMITKGDILKVGDRFGTPCLHTLSKSIIPEILMKLLPIFADVYRSDEKDPKYTGEKYDCERVGILMIPPPPSGWPPISFLVQELVAGEAEFTVRAYNINSMTCIEGQLDFLHSIPRH
ncbi:heat shock 70 kDa protein 12A-like [Ruditapes philippinarum]|uniref:heat shock 70 kDa protein 12A-like n=1 Tax=Ruditapes philippinarum TaxID=129788 RepID=UPI00295BB989|nr:heat shock 70 kDa protein 12A-like [Ruditapes philippinarum]XP_060589160.1 heat shock 70 kDa protein 12A-like [Ruditapes philippinarum]